MGTPYVPSCGACGAIEWPDRTTCYNCGEPKVIRSTETFGATPVALPTAENFQATRLARDIVMKLSWFADDEEPFYLEDDEGNEGANAELVDAILPLISEALAKAKVGV